MGPGGRGGDRGLLHARKVSHFKHEIQDPAPLALLIRDTRVCLRPLTPSLPIRVLALCNLILQRLLGLRPTDLEAWLESPEDFMLEEEQVSQTDPGNSLQTPDVQPSIHVSGSHGTSRLLTLPPRRTM